MPYAPGRLGDRSVIIYMTGALCSNPVQIFQSPHAVRVLQRFIERLQRYDSPLLELLRGFDATYDDGDTSEAAYALARVLGLLVDWRPENIAVRAPDVASMVRDRPALAQMVEQLYDFWRELERYLIFEGGAKEDRDRALAGHTTFILANEDLTDLVRDAYRRIESNLRGHWPRVYRQVPAGANVSLLIDRVEWPCPGEAYAMLPAIRMVRLALLNPPVILYPRQNRREGRFVPVQTNPIERAVIDPEKWLCLPLMVGQLRMLVYFDRDYLGLAVALVNLFELSGHEEARAKPDGILMFGVPGPALGPEPTVFCEDEANDMVVAAVAKSEAADYLGYFKKMLLTMHNVIMLRRGRLPIHGAMCRMVLKSGEARNVIIVGDSGAGKSETLEAFRQLADEHVRELTIIFDDMGSIELTPDGRLVGYGTEIGAFVRLDDLDPGYAFGRIDRSILMNPHRQNARVVLPITEYADVVAGHEVDLLLYANNHEAVDDGHPVIEYAATPAEALHVFRSGLRASKGTTDETGVVATYFGNPFPFNDPLYRERHEPIAERFMDAAFAAGVQVGQVRTQLGREGMEREGPMLAADALFAQTRRGA